MINKIAVSVVLLVILRCEGQSLLGGLFSGVQGVGKSVHGVIRGIGGAVGIGRGHGHRPHIDIWPWHKRPMADMEEPAKIIPGIQENHPHTEYGPPSHNYKPHHKPGYPNSPPDFNSNYNTYHYHHHHHENHNRPSYDNEQEHHGENGHYHHANNYGQYGTPNYNHGDNGIWNGNKKPYHHGYNFNKPSHNHGNYNKYPNNDNYEQQHNGYELKPVSDPSNGGYEYQQHVHPTGYEPKPTTKPSDKPTLVPLNPNQYVYGGDKIDINVPMKEAEVNQTPDANYEEDVPIDIRFGE